jgi:GNAT superfamily N-acetyltransferase
MAFSQSVPIPDLVLAQTDVRDAVCIDLLDRYEQDLKSRMSPDFDLSVCAPPGPDDFEPPAGVFLVALLGGEPVACGGLRTIGPGIGEIRRMYVSPAARGKGVGKRVLEALERAAADRDLNTVRLDTTNELTEAHRLYERAGYQRIPDYNGDICAERWYEKRL